MITRKMFRAASFVIGLALAGNLVAAPATCEMVRVDAWPVRIVHNALIVDGAINGKRVGVMLDTGAGTTMIMRSAAKQLGLARQPALGYRAFGIGGETAVEVAAIDEFKIGEAARKALRMYVAGEYDLGGEVGLILGDDFFHQFDVEFDLAHNAVRLFQSKDCDGVSLAYWAKETPSVVDIAPVDETRPQIVITVQVNGRNVRALLDSGASSSVLDEWEASQAGITPETPGVVAFGAGGGLGRQTVDAWLGPIRAFNIGDEMIQDTTLQFADIYKQATYLPPGSRIPRKVDELQPMLLGVDFLRSHRVLIAHTQRKMYFNYVGGPVFQVDKAPEPQTAKAPEPQTTKAAEPRTAKPSRESRSNPPPQFDYKP
jgi:predicted aspartyl protease